MTAPATNATHADKTSTTEAVARLDDLAVGAMQLAKVGERRIVVVRTPSGVHALDNACPHQGYGLATGSLDGELLTCQWHNWKFEASTGKCLMGQEDVACHQVDIVDDEVHVTVTEPTPEELRAQLEPSLLSGIEQNYVGQVARDAARLLATGATPDEIMWIGLDHALPREQWGPDHAMATAVDCLAWSTERTGDERALALIQGLAALAEPTRGRDPHQSADPDPAIDFGTAVESEDLDGATAAAAQLAIGDIDTARRQFIAAASQHHLSYGHGIIFVQKAFELLDRTGWSHAPTILPHLARTITWGTREDTLPYMRTTTAAVAALDLAALAAIDTDPAWEPDGGLDAFVDALLDADHAPIDIAVSALTAGCSVDRLLDTIVLACSRRLIRYDIELEFDADEPFRWLDITHGLTAARAARWAWELAPGPDTLRQVMWAVWLLFDTGRAERRHGIAPEPVVEPAPGDVWRSIVGRDIDATLAAISADPAAACDRLIDAALADLGGSFIVAAHLIKLTQACIEEYHTTGSTLPLLAAGRYLAAPRLERFVTFNANESLDFVATGRPPKR